MFIETFMEMVWWKVVCLCLFQHQQGYQQYYLLNQAEVRISMVAALISGGHIMLPDWCIFKGITHHSSRSKGRGSGKTSAHVPVSCRWLDDLLAMPDSIPISHFTFITVQAVPHSSAGAICVNPLHFLCMAVCLQLEFHSPLWSLKCSCNYGTLCHPLWDSVS